MITYFDWLCYHRLLVAIRLSRCFYPLMLISLNLLSVLFLFLGSEGGGYLAVKGSEVGFELFQFVLFAPRLRDYGFELWNIGFEFGRISRSRRNCCQSAA